MSDSQRGVAGAGSILTITSYPNRTSPVLEASGCSRTSSHAAASAAADVPALKTRALTANVNPSDSGSKPSSECGLRELSRTRWIRSDLRSIISTPSAGGERSTMAARQWMQSGALPTTATGSRAGRSRTLLLARREQFVGTVAERLLAFAVGRGVEYYDQPAVRAILRESTADYRSELRLSSAW